MDYKKKSLKKLNCPESYEEIDTRLATGWYVNSVGNYQKKKYKTKEVSYKISKKKIDSKFITWIPKSAFITCLDKKTGTIIL